ncbi:hypothetical protein GH733_017053 [Mirounga leonina]|nr:hypothetical protein GH733_017053 [Mirounga leonina]
MAGWGLSLACLTLFLLRPGPPAPQRLPRLWKKRTVYLKEQLQELRKYFTMNRYPSYEERLTLAARLDLEEHQVQVWFKNRRANHSRLQGLPKGRGQGAPAVPRGRGDPASVPAPVPAQAPVPVPAHPAFPGILGISSVAQHSPTLVPAQQDPEQGSREHVPAAQAPVPAPDPARPQGSPASDFFPDPVLAPNFTGLLLPQDPLEESSFPLMSGSQEGEDPADDSDSEAVTGFIGESVPTESCSSHGARGDEGVLRLRAWPPCGWGQRWRVGLHSGLLLCGGNTAPFIPPAEVASRVHCGHHTSCCSECPH